MEWFGIFAVAFLMQGASRVFDDLTAAPVDKPGYARSPGPLTIMLAMSIWWWRQPPISIVVKFTLTFGFVWLLFWLLGLVVSSAALRLAIVLFAPPLISIAAFHATSLLAAFRAKPERTRREPRTSVDEIFSKLERGLRDEKAQNENLPEPFRSKVLEGPDCDQLPGSTGEFGRVPQNPIPVNGPLGELVYLSSLQSETGQRVLFHRIASIGEIDLFETVTFNGAKWDLLFLHAYHPRKSRLAPSGYSLVSPSDERTALLGTNKSVAGFPNGLPEAISTTTEQFLGIPIAGRGVREALKKNTFVPPADHQRMVALLLLKIAEWRRRAVKT
jgi:hypothetical protein